MPPEVHPTISVHIYIHAPIHFYSCLAFLSVQTHNSEESTVYKKNIFLSVWKQFLKAARMLRSRLQKTRRDQNL